MMNFLFITIIAAIVSGLYFYYYKQATISINMFPGIMLGSSFIKYNVEYKKKDEDNGKTYQAEAKELRYRIVFISIDILWVES